MVKINMVDAINQALDEEMKRDERVMILGEDVGYDGGVFRVTDGLVQKYGEDRVVDTPLAESAIIGTSIGLATYGMRPVAEVQFMGFLYPGFDQLASHASRIRNRSRGRFTCPMVVRVPYGGGIHAPEHHSESWEAILAHTPGLKVVIPSGPKEAKGLLISAIRDPDPVIFLEPKKVYRAIKEEVPKGSYTIPIGKANVVQQGKDVTVVGYGSMMRTIKKAIDGLKTSVELIDLRTISPMDTATVIESVKKTGRCVVVHEGPRTCGVGAELSAQVMEKALLHLIAPVERVTGFDTIFPLYKNEHLYLPDEHRVQKAIAKVMNF